MKKQLLIIVLVFSIVSLYAQTTFDLVKSDVKIEGTSNIHDWVSTAKNATVECSMLTEVDALKSIELLKVTIPVKGIISTKGSIMYNKTWNALKHDDHPNITFELIRVNSMVKTGQYYDIKATGKLSMAGAFQVIDIATKARFLPNGQVNFTGKKSLLMTDYKIDPPTALFGTMTTGNGIKIKFDVTLGSISKVYNSMN